MYKIVDVTGYQELINKHYNILNENDIYIWNYISNNKKECESLSIDNLAHKCNVSRTTILRFAQKISLKGYSELKLYLKLENQVINENDNKNQIIIEQIKITLPALFIKEIIKLSYTFKFR